MPGEQPLGVPPPTMTGDLQPCPAASGTGAPPKRPSDVGVLAGRTPKAMGSGVQATEAPEAQVRQALKTGGKAPLPSTQCPSSTPVKGSRPRAPAGRSLALARARQAGRADGRPPQLPSLSIASSRPRPAVDEKTLEGAQAPDVEAPLGHGTDARLRPGQPRAQASPAAEELSFRKCLQKTPSSFTTTSCTSPSATPGPPPLRAPQSGGASPRRLAAYPEFQANEAIAWPPSAGSSFPGAGFGAPPAEPQPFPDGGSPGVLAFQFPFPELPAAGPKPFPGDAAGPGDAKRALVFAFHQPRGAWLEEPVRMGQEYPLSTRPAAPPPPCYPGRVGGLEPPGDPSGAHAPPGAAPPGPGPFSESVATFQDTVHESRTKVPPEKPPSVCDGLGSPRGPPNALPQRRFPRQAYGSPASQVGASPGSRDAELAASGPPSTRLPQLWDPAPAPFPAPVLGPPASATSAFFEAQPSPGQRLSVPQSSPVPWPQGLPASGPGPHQLEMLNQLPFPPGVSEWQGGNQGALAAAGKTPGPGEKLAVLRNSPGQHGGGSPGLFTYNGLKDPGAQPLFFGVAPPQASPRGTPGLPPPRVVGASPSESPLPSPATHTASSSTCSSLSPLSSSPANPSSEESQLPGPLGAAAFFLPPAHPQETSSPFPSPEPPHAHPAHCQPELARAFPFSAEGLEAEGAFTCLEETPFPGSGLLPRAPPPYSAHHFPLSSASLDQLDVLLTCRQCDRNYSSLAAFLGHRQFCGLLLAKAKDGPQQPPGLPVPPAAPPTHAAPKAPAGGSPSPLSQTKPVPLLLGGDIRPDGREEPLRTSFLPGLAPAPFPLPAADLDLEDDAKLDSLITEALNGLEYQSDSPEIDSSFIDVFTDEEPPGPRAPAAAQPPKTRVGATPENKAQPTLPAVDTPLEPQPLCSGEGAGPRSKTRSLGPAPTEAEGAGLVGKQRRGKRFKLFQKELDTASTAKRPGRATRATRLRPRRKGSRAEPPPPRARDLRAQAPKSRTDPAGRALLVETRSSRRLRLSPGQDSRRRRARGGAWSKEFIQKIVQQKNRARRPQAPPGRPRPGGRRRRRGEKRKEADSASGPREDEQQQKPRKVVRQEAERHGRSPGPEELGRPWPDPIESPKAQGPSHSPQERGPRHLLQVLTGAKTPEEKQLSLDGPQDAKNPKMAESPPLDTTDLRTELPSSSPGTCGRGGTRRPSPEPPQPPRSSATPGAPRCSEPAVSLDGQDSPATPPGESPVPVADATDTAHPEPSALFLRTPSLGRDPVVIHGDSGGVRAAPKGPHPYNEAFLGPKDVAGFFHEDLRPPSSVPDSLPASRPRLCQDRVDASPREPKPLGRPACTVVTSPGQAESPPASEPTPLFSGLPTDGFHLPVCGSLSGNRDTHLPRPRATPPPGKPHMDPPYPSFPPKKGWSVLEEASPVLSSHLGPYPGLSEEKALSQKCPEEAASGAKLPASPGEVMPASGPLGGYLSEDELEIRKLVSELESQLQSKGARGAPRQQPGVRVTCPGGLGQDPEGVRAAVATRGSALGSPQEDWPPFHLGEAAPPSGAHEDVVSGGPFSPTGAGLGSQPLQRARVCKRGLPGAGGDLRTPCSLEPRDPLTPACSPKPEPSLADSKGATRTQHGQDLALLPPCTRRWGLSPGLHPDSLELDTFGSPAAQLAPDLAFQVAPPPSGASHSRAPQEHSVSSTAGPEGAGPPHSETGGLGLEGNEELVTTGASPSGSCMPEPSPDRRARGPAASPLHQLQLLVARAAEREDDTLGLEAPPPADAQSPQHSHPADLGRDGAEVEVACRPACGFLTTVQMTAAPAGVGRHLGPERAHLGSHSQAEGHRGPAEASQWQPDDQGRPGTMHDLAAANADPETTAARLAGAADRPGGRLQGSRAAVGLWNEAQATASPTGSEAGPSSPASPAAHTRHRPDPRAREGAGGPQARKHLLFAAESPVPTTGDLAGCTSSPPAAASPHARGLEPLPREDPPPAPWGEPRGRPPATPSCGDPTSVQPSTTPSPAQAALKRADCTPAPEDTGAPPAAPPPLRTSLCGLSEGGLARCPVLGNCRPLEDPPRGQPGFIGVLTPALGGDRPGGHVSRTLEGSGIDRPREPPARGTPPHPARAVSPKGTVGAAALPRVPTRGGLGAVSGPRAAWPDPEAAPPNRPLRGNPVEPPSAPSGNREGWAVTAVPTDRSPRGPSGPDPPSCPEGEAEASNQGQEGVEVPSGVTETLEANTGGLPVTCASAGLRPGRAATPSSVAGDLRPHSPQSLGDFLYLRPQGHPLSPQDARPKPRGFTKQPVFAEDGHCGDGAPGGRPVTCEVSVASSRSWPGRSRHRARKHGLRGATASQPSPPALPAPQPGGPTAQKGHAPGRKSRRVPGKEKLRRLARDPSRAVEPPPVRASVAVLGAPGCPLDREPHPPGLGRQGVDVKPAEPRNRDWLERDGPRPKQAEKGGGQRRGRPPADAPSELEGKSNRKAGKPRTRRFREDRGPRAPSGATSDGSGWGPSAAVSVAPPSCRRSPEIQQETQGTQLPLMAPELEETPARKSPGDWVPCLGMVGGVPPEEEPAGRTAALAGGSWRLRETRTPGVCKEPSRVAAGRPAGDSRAAESSPGRDGWEGPPETQGSEAGGTVSSCSPGPPHGPGDGVPGPAGTAPGAPSPCLQDPLSLFDDEASFSRLFPLGDRLAQKKQPRVYGKRCKKPKPPPRPEPSGQPGGGALSSARLPTDLSDSGSLCLSHEDPWGEGAAGVPESFLLDGFLSSKVPGIDPWAPGPSLWTLEAGPDPRHTEDHQSDNIPELHMVPEAWRGLEMQPPTDEAASSPGDASPEPPNLERERYDLGVPGSAVDLEPLGAKLEMQDLCFLGPCEDPAGLPCASFLDLKATAGPQDPRSRAEEAVRARKAPGRGQHAKARRAPYKCRVCFQRFHGLGELDLHKLAHSPAPPPTCYMCVERRFGSRELLREHLQEKHVQSKAGLWACGMCLRQVADVWMYNEHLREHAVRFARKGQARRPLGDLPGCWAGDGVVTRFLSGISLQASKPHRAKRSAGKAGGGRAEASERDVGVGRGFPRERPRPKARADSSDPDGASAQGSPAARANPAPLGDGASPDACSNGEPLLPAVPVHQDCKDPARDCHHCGKRFPKPFKLQRHLAVHSPQRVYLCPQCPRVYPEHRELRAHLAGEHGLSGELELQHTPLYACELCANVTHISKRSFVCSSCNYTFAKKEQFDRHMDKHRRRGQQPFTFRGVRRPGAPGQKAPARESSLPSKRRRVAVPSSPPGSDVSLCSSPALSEGSLSARLQLCPEAAPSTTAAQPRTPERPVASVGHPVRDGDLPSDLQGLLSPSFAPFPEASPDGKDGPELDQALGSSEDPGSPGPFLQQALPLGGSLPRPGARGQDVEGKGAAGLLPEKHRTPSAPGRCTPSHRPEVPSLLWEEKQGSTSAMAPAAGTGGLSHRGSATKPGGGRGSSKDRPASSSSSRAPRFPGPLKKAVTSPTPRELARGTEDRPKPTILKAKPGPSSQSAGGPQQDSKTAGGSQPQPASGQLQSETATTPAKPSCPGQGRAPAKAYPKGPREAGDQGPRRSLGPREDRDISEKTRKSRALGPTRSESAGSLGRGPSVPDKPPRTPRKQATPSRVLPAKARPSGQNSETPPHPSEPRKGEPSQAHGAVRRGKEGLGKALPQGRPLHRPPRKGGAAHGAELATSRACRTAESQNHLLSQLFGQRLTSFKIPLKKDSSE
uniref:Zinc finger protein 469 n=1 Tax=Catagonus wagneri TaxID=51154 RepID=A0A8C3X6F4_9CETA